MSQQAGLNRRWFLKNAGLGALAAGAASAGAPLAAAPFAPSAEQTFAPGPNGKYDFDTPYNRFGTNSVKYDQQIRVFGPNSVEVGMGIADMDFRAAPSITKALQERLKHENWGYLDMPASFTEGIVGWNKRHYGVDLRAVAAGDHDGRAPRADRHAQDVLAARAPRCCCRRRPTTASTATSPPPRRSRRKCRSSSSTASSRWTSRSSRSRSASTPTRSSCATRRTRPATAGAPEDLLRIGEICLKHRVVVLADEIHCDFVTKGQKYTPFASLPNKAVVDNSITFKAASKSFGLAAHKIAWFYSTNPDYMDRIKVNHRAELNTLGVVANQGAYTPEGEDWLKQVVEYVDGNHEFAAGLHQPQHPDGEGLPSRRAPT